MNLLKNIKKVLQKIANHKWNYKERDKYVFI